MRVTKRELLKKIRALERHTKHVENRLSTLLLSMKVQDMINVTALESHKELIEARVKALEPKKKAPAKKKQTQTKQPQLT